MVRAAPGPAQAAPSRRVMLSLACAYIRQDLCPIAPSIRVHCICSEFELHDTWTCRGTVLQDTAKNTQHLEHRKSQACNVKKQKAVRSLRTPCATKQKPDSLTMFNQGSKLSTGSKFSEKAGINSQINAH